MPKNNHHKSVLRIACVVIVSTIGASLMIALPTLLLSLYLPAIAILGSLLFIWPLIPLAIIINIIMDRKEICERNPYIYVAAISSFLYGLIFLADFDTPILPKIALALYFFGGGGALAGLMYWREMYADLKGFRFI